MTETALHRATRPAAYSYIRFSDSKQFRGDSLRRQLERSRLYAERHGLHLDESTTIRDLGVSAFRGANRTIGSFSIFLQAVKDGKIASGSYLLVESFDRMSRETPLDALEMFISLLNAGIVIVTLIDETVHSREKYTNDWTGIVVSLSKFAQANEESAKKSDRLAHAWENKRRAQAAGVIATAKCPGWLSKEGGAFVVDEAKAAVVRRIFDEFIGGKGRGLIAQTLNKEKVRPFGHGSEWHGGTVQKVTTNAAVIGHFQPHSVIRQIVDGPDGQPMMREKRVPVGEVIENYYPQIVAPETFYRAQAVAADRSVVPGNTGGRKGTVYSNIFSGLTRCVLCGRTMVYKDRGPRSSVVLICSGSRSGTCGNQVRYIYRALENAVLDWVQELDLGETRPAALSAAEGRVVLLAAKRDELADLARAMVDQFNGQSRFVNERLLRMEAEIDDLERQLVTARRQLAEVRGALPIDERKAQIGALRSRMAAATGPNLYAIRANLAQSLREVVRVMVFHRFGRVQLVLKGGEKQYMLDPHGSGALAAYAVKPWTVAMNPLRHQDELAREVIDFHPRLTEELVGQAT